VNSERCPGGEEEDEVEMVVLEEEERTEKTVWRNSASKICNNNNM